MWYAAASVMYRPQHTHGCFYLYRQLIDVIGSLVMQGSSTPLALTLLGLA